MKDKKTLITIIVLLVIFLPLAVLGTYKNFSSKPKTIEDNNKNKEYIYNNKVWFYPNGILTSTYDCDNCTVSEPVLDDTEYHTNSYTKGTLAFGPYLDTSWAIFKKNDKDVLYNMVGKMVAVEYQAVKSYRVETENNLLITKTNNKWGASFLDMSATGIKNEYDYLALPAHFNNDKLETKKFIGKINGSSPLWYILNADGTAVRPAVRDEIVDFNDNYYIIYRDGYKVMDYNDNEHLTNLKFKNIYAVDKYIFAIMDSNMLLIYEDCDKEILENLTIPEYEEIYFSKTEKGVDIFLDKNLYKSIELA